MITIHQRHRQTDRRTDRQTTCDRNTALCTKVHRAAIKPMVMTINPLLTAAAVQRFLCPLHALCWTCLCYKRYMATWWSSVCHLTRSDAVVGLGAYTSNWMLINLLRTASGIAHLSSISFRCRRRLTACMTVWLTAISRLRNSATLSICWIKLKIRKCVSVGVFVYLRQAPKPFDMELLYMV